VATGREPPAHLPAGWRAARRTDLLSAAAEAAGIVAVVRLEVKHHVTRPTPADIRGFHHVNVDGAQDWLDWASRHGVRRFVFLSSIKVVPSGDEAERVADETGLSSGRPAEPDTP
jgi:nucleoside-diphosphate-sugar epimerase